MHSLSSRGNPNSPKVYAIYLWLTFNFVQGVPCEFLPSRRSGQVPYNAGKRKRDINTPGRGFYAPVEQEKPIEFISTNPEAGPSRTRWEQGLRPAVSADSESLSPVQNLDPERDVGSKEEKVPSAMGHIGSLDSSADNRPNDTLAAPFPRHEFGRSGVQDPSSAILPPPLSSADLFASTRSSEHSPSGGSVTSPFSAQRKTAEAGPEAKRRHGSESLTVASLRNPVEALDLLSLAAAGEAQRYTQERDTAASSSSGTPSGTPQLDDFPLVRDGTMSGRELCELVSEFFSRSHFIFPSSHFSSFGLSFTPS